MDLVEKRREQMFPKLTPAQLVRFAAHCTRRETAAGEILLNVGERPSGLFIVAAGSVEVLAPTSDVHTATCGYNLLNVLTAGDFSGEMSTLRGTPGLAQLRVREPGAVLHVGLDDVRRLVQSDAELSELMMRAFILRRMGIVQSGSGDVTVLGSSHAGNTLRIREFLTRNTRPYGDINIDQDPDARALLERFHVQPQDLPVVVCRGKVLRNPDNTILADCLGINGQPDDSVVHDVIIIGAGPAGLAAAVYAASEGLDVRVVDSFAPGGQAGTSSRIENYLGFPTGISGAALAGRALSQAQKFGAQLSIAWQAERLHCDEWPYAVEMSNGSRLRGRAVVIASGAQYRLLEVANVDRFLGSGVYYAATHLEARLCDGEDVAIVGGGNSAGQAAVFLAGSCRHVHVLVRSADLAESMSAYLIRRIEDSRNITLHTRTQITALSGVTRLEQVEWTTGKDTPQSRDLRHVFLMTGASPNTDWLAGCVTLDDQGFVKTGPDLTHEELANWRLARHPYLLESSTPGVFAAGDVRAGSVKRIASAVGEGSTTVQFVHRALRDLAAAPPQVVAAA
ncbi:MAG TPA: FAD-dependent oxidoreductase [Steroidobacteraceae bacterium]|jgi:thioredoxin reductase (NADPH)|nr:FAD-dependent oxidoreductase [Steroidobacteraceae bacterium]